MIQTFVQSLTRGSLVAMVSLLFLTGCKSKPKTEAPDEDTRAEVAVTEQESIPAPAPVPALAEQKKIEIGVHKAIVLQSQFAVTRAAVRDSSVAYVDLLNPTHVLVGGFSVGRATVTLTGSTGQTQVLEVTVVAKVPPTANVIRIAPGAKTTIETNGAIARLMCISIDTAAVQALSETTVSVEGRTEGETQVIIFTVDNRVLIYDVIVAKDIGP